MSEKLKPFWVRWDGGGGFEYRGPWWCSGYAYIGEDASPIFVAAVMAANEEDAMRVINHAHDDKANQKWSFVNEREAGWEPFCDRFPRADWMQWPWPEAACHSRTGAAAQTQTRTTEERR